MTAHQPPVVPAAYLRDAVMELQDRADFLTGLLKIEPPPEVEKGLATLGMDWPIFIWSALDAVWLQAQRKQTVRCRDGYVAAVLISHLAHEHWDQLSDWDQDFVGNLYQHGQKVALTDRQWDVLLSMRGRLCVALECEAPNS